MQYAQMGPKKGPATRLYMEWGLYVGISNRYAGGRAQTLRVLGVRVGNAHRPTEGW